MPRFPRVDYARLQNGSPCPAQPKTVRRQKPDKNIYQIDVVDSKIENGVQLHLIKYVGYSEEHDEWRPAKDLIHLPNNIDLPVSVPTVFTELVKFQLRNLRDTIQGYLLSGAGKSHMVTFSLEA